MFETVTIPDDATVDDLRAALARAGRNVATAELSANHWRGLAEMLAEMLWKLSES